MGKRKAQVIPRLRIKTPYTRFASDFWACYKAHGHQRAVISKPRFDQTEGKILFEFLDDVMTVTSPQSDIICDSSARSALFDFCKNPKPERTVDESVPSVSLLKSPQIDAKSPGCDEKPCHPRKLTLTSPTCEPLTLLSAMKHDVDSDDVEVIPDPLQSIPTSEQTVDVTTSPSCHSRERQGQIIGFMSKIISEKWAASDSALKEEYRRQTAQEKSTYLETMIAVHLRHGFPLPAVRVDESRCMNMLFKSLYKWYKRNPYILELGYPGRVGSDPVMTTLRAKCAKFVKKETEQCKQLFVSRTLINLDSTTAMDEDDNPDADMMDYPDNRIATPGTSSTPQSPQFTPSDQLSCSTDAAVASSTPEKSGPETDSQPSTPIIKIQSVLYGGSQGQSGRTFHTIEPCYASPPRVLNVRSGSASNLHPLSPPLTPVLAAKLPGSNFLRPPPPPPPPPPSMLYSTYGVGQVSEDTSSASKAVVSSSSWLTNVSPETPISGPVLYGLPPRLFYPGYQWTTALPSLTPYPLSTPALQQSPDMFLVPPPPISPSNGSGSPVQGNDVYFSQQSNYFNTHF